MKKIYELIKVFQRKRSYPIIYLLNILVIYKLIQINKTRFHVNLFLLLFLPKKNFK